MINIGDKFCIKFANDTSETTTLVLLLKQEGLWWAKFLIDGFVIGFNPLSSGIEYIGLGEETKK